MKMFHAAAAAVETQTRHRHARDAVGALIEADAFDAAAADTLARHTYADAVAFLLDIVKRPGHDLVSILLSNQFVPYRFAVAFSVVSGKRSFKSIFGIENLRALRTREARLALIASGEPMDWQTADRPERAVFALRHIVLRMRGRI